MNIERHGHVMPMPRKARCGGPRFCKVCQREQAYEEGRLRACQATRPHIVMYQSNIGISAVQEMLTQAFMDGAEWKDAAANPTA